MDRERGDEIPYGEPMKIPEHMDSADLFDGPSDDDLRASLREWLAAPPDAFDASEFFEGYIDPEGPFRWTGDFDAWDAIDVLVRDDPHLVAECLRDWQRECN